MKLFADDTSIFSFAKDATKYSNEINSDLKIVNNQAFQWKSSFNPDPLRQETEVRFNKTSNEIDHQQSFAKNIGKIAQFKKKL